MDRRRVLRGCYWCVRGLGMRADADVSQEIKRAMQEFRKVIGEIPILASEQVRRSETSEDEQGR